MKRIEDFSVGESEKFVVKITPETHEQFKNLSGDESPVHTDEEFAKKSGFENKIAYAFNVLSYFSRLYGEYLPGGSSVCIRQNAKFHKPIYIRDILTIKGTVTHISVAAKVLTIKNEVLNQKGDICISGEGVVRFVV